MQIPDIVGFTIGEAEVELRSSGMEIEKITILSPPREKNVEYDADYRVIRVLETGPDKLELQICKPL